jgi:nitroreductase
MLESSGVDDLFTVMDTCRAMRWLRPDPVDPALVERLVWAATRAPSPANTQDWDFVVVDDAAAKQRIADAVREAMAGYVAALPRPDRTARLMLDGTAHLLDTLAVAPVLIFVCGGVHYPAGRPDEQMTWSALYPAAQNLLLAARGLGLGAVFTTLHRAAQPVVRDVLAIPDDVRIAATIPIGWPDRPFGPVVRRPVAEVIHRNRW